MRFGAVEALRSSYPELALAYDSKENFYGIYDSHYKASQCEPSMSGRA
ncbi:unnamed protein product [Acidithrix sp. C25]|nr:unnamed protein product [Acidithrix sp. C25]